MENDDGEVEKETWVTSNSVIKNIPNSHIRYTNDSSRDKMTMFIPSSRR